MGITEIILAHNLSFFKTDGIGFYLQYAYVKDWIDNSMLFPEVDDVNHFWNKLLVLNLPAKYKAVKIVPIREQDWGRECFIHVPFWNSLPY